MKTLQPCGTPAAYRRHYDRGEKPCDPCAQAKRDHSQKQRRKEGIPARTTTPELAAEILFLLNAGEGHHRILTATGYEGRTKNLRDRLVKNGYADPANRIFNTWELAA